MQLKRLGPYEIEKPLGKGGMGFVYAAVDKQSGQRVAIKALTPHLATAEGFRERFEAEIESLKTLRHDGIVRLYGYGEQDGVLFYSMELVEGTSLEDELRAGRRFNWREVTNIAIQLSMALKHAHDHGIVHRDIKPANVLLHDEDRVKLADFGIARLFGTTQLTTAGGVLGTADYMSPEQAEGRPVTARCDQYSLGGVMYALLTGRPPFLAKNLPQMLQLQRFAEPEPVRRFAPDTPEQLEQVIAQLLAKNPSDRFPNTQVLARHLQALLRALSRPHADDFALEGEDRGPVPAEFVEDRSLALKATQADPSIAESVPRAAATRHEAPSRRTIEEAATLAANEVTASRRRASSNLADSVAVPNASDAAAKRPARFTTLEEEEARLRALQRRPWLVVGAQIVLLVAVLAGIGTAIIHVTTPPTADELYAAIAARVDDQDDASLATVASKVNEFLNRFPEDERAVELQQYKERVELDKLERRMQRQARMSGVTIGDLEALPVEQLYLRAVRITESDPEEALTMLQALIDLYGVEIAGEENGQVSAIVQLAQRRLVALRADVERKREQQVQSLKERLESAKFLSTESPGQAAAMYRAIIDLHDRDEWAADIVAEARNHLVIVEKD